MAVSRGTPISAQIQVQIIESQTEAEILMGSLPGIKPTARAMITGGQGRAYITGGSNSGARP